MREGDESKRQQIREWLAELEDSERVRIIQFFALQFGLKIQPEMIRSKGRPLTGIDPPNEKILTTAAGKSM